MGRFMIENVKPNWGIFDQILVYGKTSRSITS